MLVFGTRLKCLHRVQLPTLWLPCRHVKTLFCVKLFGRNRKFGWKETAERSKFAGLRTADVKEVMSNTIAELLPVNGITNSNYVVLYEALEEAYQHK